MVLLTNCTAQPPNVLNTDDAAAQETNTITPTIKPSQTVTQIPRHADTPTLVSTSTWTPLPTLSEQQAREKINGLLETNNGCELPCWWGILPNETKWTEASHFLRPFIVDLEARSDVRIENGNRRVFTEIQFYYDAPNETAVGRMTLGAIDDIVVRMTVYPPGVEYKYQLHQLLTLLGPPKQILVNAQSSSPIPELPPTVLTLDYSDAGVWASYGYIPIRVGENLVICPESSLGKVTTYHYDNLGGRFELFGPKMEYPGALSIEEYANMVGGFTAKRLEDVTNMNIEKFYTTFIDPVPEICLETPADLWP